MLPASAMSGFNSFSTGNVNLQIPEVSPCKMLTLCYLMGVLFVKTPVRCGCVFFWGGWGGIVLFCFVLFFSFVSFFLVGILLGFLNIVYSTVPVYH